MDRHQHSAPRAVAPLDLTGQASIAAFVAGWSGPLHVLVNNAGVMAAPLTGLWHVSLDLPSGVRPPHLYS